MTPYEARKLLINFDLEFCTDQNGYPYVRNLSDQKVNIDWFDEFDPISREKISEAVMILECIK